MRPIAQASLFVSLLGLTLAPTAFAAQLHGTASTDSHVASVEKSTTAQGKKIAEQLRAAVKNGDLSKKRLTLVNTSMAKEPAALTHAAPASPMPLKSVNARLVQATQ